MHDMCGIVGHVVLPRMSPDVEAVAAGMTAMRHRGPDGDGLTKFSIACIGHRRLSIIDIAGSTQPWSTEDKRYTISFNGEIYNFLELRAGLEKDGFSFRTQGDTEVLLHMYVRDGAACLKKLNGMFAFAVWDEAEKILFLARDRLGKKPLYYSLSARGLAFASEFGALSGFANIDRTVDAVAVQDFFAHQFIGGARTIWQGIRKLPAAHYLVYRDGRATIGRYWTPPYPDGHKRAISELSEELRELLDDAVKLRLRSDVPLGAFLSGGLDSCAVVAAMTRAGAAVTSFTVGFREPSFDESEPARAAADYFSTRHHERVLSMESPSALEECIAAFGEPFGDPSALPTSYLCQHAREHVTVALSGDGVDELFGGYRRYYARRWIDRFRYLPQWLRNDVLMRIVSELPDSEAYFGQSRIKQLKLFSRMVRVLEESPCDPLAQVFSFNERNALLTGDGFVSQAVDYIEDYKLESLEPLSQMMFADLNTYLVDDILVKVDRMSMHHSIEVRSPFLDYRIVEFACRLPLDAKIRGSVQKYLIRRCFRQTLPAAVRSRRKHGFAVPLANWFRGPLKALFTSVVFDRSVPDFINRKEIQHIWERHQGGRCDNGFKLWCLLVFFLWFQNQRLPK